MFALVKSKNKSSSRNQIAIEGARDGVLILPNNQYRAVLEISPVNFELKSEDEQDAIIDTYESFLNSVGSSLQILVRTREIDMDKYLDGVNERLESETEKVYRQQLLNYDEFVRSLIQSNKILTRHFYVIVPYVSSSKTDFELVKEQLGLTVDIVAKGMTRMGMYARTLSSLEILDLFYGLYNPTQAKLQPLTERALRLVHEALTRDESKGGKV